MIRDTSKQDKQLSSPKNGRRKLAIATLVSGLIVALSAYAFPKVSALYSSDKRLDAASLRFATVQKGDLSRDIVAQGKIVAAVSPTFYAPADGTVTLYVKAGDEVKPDQRLASIESPRLNSLLSQESSTLDSLELAIGRQKIDTKTQLLSLKQRTEMAKVDLMAAEREMQRADLSKQNELISEVEFEQIQVALNKAQLTAKHAKESELLEKERLTFELQSREKDFSRQQFVVNELKRQVDQLEILAPFEGIIGTVDVQEKQAVTQNMPLLTAVDMRAFEVEVQIPEIYADDLGPGMKVEIPMGNDKVDAQLTAISPEVNNGQVAARIRFLDTPLGLRQNQRISARIMIESKPDVLKVKRGPFMDGSGGKVAFIVEGDLARRANIQLGAISVGEVEVISGLNQGDRIIISNTEQYSKNNTIFITN